MASAPKRAQPLGVGSVIQERFRLKAEIGRGGMGVVYRARDLAGDRDVAVKIVNAETADARTPAQFLREAEIASHLHHPHIAQVYSTGTIETGERAPIPFIAMEFVPGPSLADVHWLTLARIIDLGRQICDALAYAHDQGLVHRDIKPQNVLLEKRGFRYIAKLVDFGLAQPLDAPRPANEAAVGTVYYIAPEVIAGQPANIAADLYSFGVVLYEMVTGRVPFSNYDEAVILAQHLDEPADPPHETRPDVPPALEAIILRLLDKDPGKRYANASQVCQALRELDIREEKTGPLSNLPPRSETAAEFTQGAAEIKRLFESARLVTILGTGQRTDQLALAAGTVLLDEFRDGAWQVDLRDRTDASLVPQEVAQVLGVAPEPGRALTVSLRQALQEKNLMLILLGCDRVHGACARLVEMLLQTCPDVYILATSIQWFNIPGEQTLAGG